MTTILIAKITIAFSVAIILILLRCWLESEAIRQWYHERYYSQPRVNDCPIKRSWYSRVLLSLFKMSITH